MIKKKYTKISKLGKKVKEGDSPAFADFCIHTGGFTGIFKVEKKMNALKELTNWWMIYTL